MFLCEFLSRFSHVFVILQTCRYRNKVLSKMPGEMTTRLAMFCCCADWMKSLLFLELCFYLIVRSLFWNLSWMFLIKIPNNNRKSLEGRTKMLEWFSFVLLLQVNPLRWTSLQKAAAATQACFEKFLISIWATKSFLSLLIIHCYLLLQLK